MQIVTKRIGDAVTIGSEIRIKVLGFIGNHIRLGIDAPDNRAIDQQNFKSIDDQQLDLELLKAQSMAPTHEPIACYENIRGE